MPSTSGSAHSEVQYQRVCTLWTHDVSFFQDNIVFNMSLFPNGTVLRDQLLSVTPHQGFTASHDFQDDAAKQGVERRKTQPKTTPFSEAGDGANRGVPRDDVNIPESVTDWFMFKAQDMSADQRTRHPNLQISISKKVAELFGLKDRSTVLITTENPLAQAASFVEFSFRDVYMTRADLRRAAAAVLRNQALYKSQEITFLGSRFVVKAIYINGKEVRSAFFGSETHPIFRSESARLVLYIQMSKEMWEFDTSRSGTVIFDKLINTFLPELFKRWAEIKARHLVSIVLFTRMEYDDESLDRQPKDRSILSSSNPNAIRDFYRVVVSHMPSAEGSKILSQLKKEYRVFLREVSTRWTNHHYDPPSGKFILKEEAQEIISGRPSLARHGNILEAINIVVSQYAQDYVDRDLVRTGLSVVIISPGTGYFEVEEGILRLTTENLVTNGIGIDLVCLSPRPLHTVPVFQFPPNPHKTVAPQTAYPQPEGLSTPSHHAVTNIPSEGPSIGSDRNYASPHWLEVHYFQDPRDPQHKLNKWTPSSRLYEMMMSGIMEIEQSEISIPFLRETHPAARGVGTGNPMESGKENEFSWMDEYDRGLFEKPQFRPPKKLAAYKGSLGRPSPAQRPRLSDVFSSSPSPGGSDFPPAPSISYHNPVVRENQKDVKTPNNDNLREKRGKEDVVATSGRGSVRKSGLRPFLLGDRGLSFSKASATTASTYTPFDLTVPPSPAETVRPQSKDESQHQNTTPDGMRIPLRKQPSTTSITQQYQLPPPPSLRSIVRGMGETGLSSSLRKRHPVNPRLENPPADSSTFLTLINPCDPKSIEADTTSRYRRWQNVYPESLGGRVVNWKSLCTPASLPLTTVYFPPEHELEHDYEESSYKVAVTELDYDEIGETTRAKLMEEMIDFRLSKGFQLVQSTPSKPVMAGSFTASQNLSVLHLDALIEEGVTLFMSKGETIHILCGLGAEVQVTRYQRRSGVQQKRDDFLATYKPFLRTAFGLDYRQQTLSLSFLGDEHNWSATDQYLGGWDREQYSESLKFWRARFVLLPVEPNRGTRPAAVLAGDTDDEVRIEGLQKLTQIWDRNRSSGHGDRSATEAKVKDPDPNPLGLEFQTHNASAVVAAGLDDSSLLEDELQRSTTRIFSEPYAFKAADLDLHKIAHAIQGEHGIPVRDRRWFVTVHNDCFVAAHLISWFMHNIKDISSRDQAVRLGQKLMEKGLFHHVTSKHHFRDGNYYFAISPEYSETRPETRSGWFSRKTDKFDKSPALSATAEGSIKELHTPRLRPAHIDTHTPDLEMLTPEKSHQNRSATKVVLSAVLEYDVGIRKSSSRPETIKIHYDRLYNPESCYHFRLEWLDANPKLIEDALTLWTATIEKYGLKLVQVPTAEMRRIGETNPFLAPYVVKLSVPPPSGITTTGHRIPKPGMTPYHFALLKHFDFVLDLESAENFPSDVDVSYSWGRLDYLYSQCIHKSGTLMAQVDDDGNLLFVANRLVASRAGAMIGPAGKMREPREVAESGELLWGIEAFCGDRESLQAFWDARKDLV